MEVNFEALAVAADLVFQWKTLMWIAIGIFMGIAGGAMPGLTAATTMALFLPLAAQRSLGPA
ncbi:MAG: hypothetical protein IH903_09540, partial [Proteobacteria bacterium]|nr:hypothetical protein [Pseudomonadota bacterium]